MMTVKYKVEVGAGFRTAAEDHYCKFVVEIEGIGKMVVSQRLENKRWRESKYMLDM